MIDQYEGGPSNNEICEPKDHVILEDFFLLLLKNGKFNPKVKHSDGSSFENTSLEYQGLKYNYSIIRDETGNRKEVTYSIKVNTSNSSETTTTLPVTQIYISYDYSEKKYYQKGENTQDRTEINQTELDRLLMIMGTQVKIAETNFALYKLQNGKKSKKST